MTSPRTPLVQACLNGRRSPDEHPAVPRTPVELAREGRAAVAAGARSLHVHPRDASGDETLDGEPRAAALAALRAACPGIEISVTTGFWIVRDEAVRLAKLGQWTVLPDLASVNVKEPGAIELCGWMFDRGIGVEAGVATAAETRLLLASGVGPRCARVLVEVEGDTKAALAEAEAIDRLLDDARLAIPRLVHGYWEATWPVIQRALELGHDVRVGLEDTLVLPDGSRAAGNGDLVAACVARRNAVFR